MLPHPRFIRQLLPPLRMGRLRLMWPIIHLRMLPRITIRAATQFNWTYDTTGPTMVITAADGSSAVSDGFTSNDATLSRLLLHPVRPPATLLWGILP